MLVLRRQSMGLQVTDVKDLKFTACQLVYTFMKQVFEGLVTYSKVKRINRGYVTHYTINISIVDSKCER